MFKYELIVLFIIDVEMVSTGQDGQHWTRNVLLMTCLYTLETAEELSKIIWRVNDFMNFGQL